MRAHGRPRRGSTSRRPGGVHLRRAARRRSPPSSPASPPARRPPASPSKPGSWLVGGLGAQRYSG
ncbi:hypothetical protein E6W39_32110 [Kitasatospora acidiphila]|uniref:Uncharacterized protein n=1 Tax=Kitasatospora acidiphila TaxID=2567942 RepID=A0A540WAG3_9ACTN|nr:hypothetical protein E6W39_32110 [Kitasatospora acidiphila]